jgi:NAD(P)-dependent dehydrogenase (short-subunit alcohol dehydrogenase family)
MLSYQPLSGQKALIVGTSSGIGAAPTLAEAGASVVLNDSSSAEGPQ